ncbi:TylF/MycF/NovP-related O-methyltransferase [Desulfosarcina ovata]|uniref:O-methyltransferase n=1 Tax=Desulfosarcina ovata subsp. ovata TaxID=2752305 RepID=A0A5K8A7E9_9BACT|nr:TylF/MycF/NovP-related O-methyltransferase [Desulfosarcina ovata]BBO88328.1 hypothetical protein DSCOOX_15080 [Desulfosarcina ovata subsp. ovata]
MDEYYWGRYTDTVREFYEALRRHEFPDLPDCNENRAHLIAQLMGTGTAEAIHLLHALHRSLPLQGDVCEFGVCQGATSALLAYEIMSTPKRLWLFDSFKGLPKPSDKDVLLNDIFNLGSMARYEGEMCCGMESVQARLDDVQFPKDRVVIVPGFIEDVLPQAILPQRVSFAYVDFDLYSPIAVTLQYLDRVLSIGGIVIVDDYGFFSAGAQTAVDEFLETRPGRYKFSMSTDYAGKFCLLEKVTV